MNEYDRYYNSLLNNYDALVKSVASENKFSGGVDKPKLNNFNNETLIESADETYLIRFNKPKPKSNDTNNSNLAYLVRFNRTKTETNDSNLNVSDSTKTKSNNSENLDNLINKRKDLLKRSLVYVPTTNDIEFINSIDISNYTHVELKHDESDKNSTTLLKVINNSSFVSTNNNIVIPNELYVESKDKTLTIDVDSYYMNLVHSRHNILVSRLSRSSLITRNYQYKRSINYFISQPLNDTIHFSDQFLLDCCVTASNYTRHIKDEVLYQSSNVLTKFIEISKELIKKYEIITLPYPLRTLINNIGIFFDSFKSQLQLNRETGQYYINYNSVEFPVMCRHVYMIYSGVPLNQISLECSYDGNCKYCGDTLASISVNDTTQFPLIVYQLIILLIEEYGGNVDNAEITNMVINYFTDIIYTYVRVDDKDYNERCTIICALICWNIIDYNYKHGRQLSYSFVFNVETILLNNGFDNDRRKYVQSKMNIGNPETIENIILTKVTHELYDFNPIFQLVDKSIQDIKNKGKMIEFNILYRQCRINNLKIDDWVSNIKSRKITIKLPQLQQMSVDNSNTFVEYIKSHCINNNSLPHEFNSTECKNCGVKCNFSNVYEVYNKYHNQFDGSYSIQTKFDLPQDKIVTDSISIIRSIDLKDSNKYLMELFKIDNIKLNVILKFIRCNQDLILSKLRTIVNIEDDFSYEDIVKCIYHVKNKEVNALLRSPFTSSNYIVYDGNDGETSDDIID